MYIIIKQNNFKISNDNDGSDKKFFFFKAFFYIKGASSFIIPACLIYLWKKSITDWTQIY